MLNRKAPLRRRPSDAAIYLEYPYKVVKTEFELRGCSCRSRFCNRCGIARGLRLRERVLCQSEAADWRNPMMWTFTVDPENFATPQEAYKHVRESRAFSNIVRTLRRDGLLLSKHYFVVLEFQKNGWPHWHLLINAKRVPFARMCELWNRLLPEGAPGLRAGLGSVRFSQSSFSGGAYHAICYATKYVIKNPEHGWPEWVMESRDNIPRYSCSRGFWLDGLTSSACKDAGEEVSLEPALPRSTIGHRVSQCRVMGMIVRADWLSCSTHSVKRLTFLGNTVTDRKSVAEEIGVDPDAARVLIPPDRVAEFLGVQNGLYDEDCREADRERLRA